MRIFLDTNVFLRYLVNDNASMHLDCTAIIKRIMEGKIKPLTSNVVFIELFYTLTRTYKFSSDLVTNALTKLFQLRNLVIIERTDTKRAFKLYRQLHIKFGDCLIATQIPKGANLVTYDDDFKKLRGLYPQTPKQLLTRLKS